ncbi:hypothetical protein V500_00391 [Pseudogymnoascus sp. VKM F-4518 (FW-2643)]|nr:hypothetical protein V500_00391 [Pseudogymnoascus sp. VKM F-4518 (FW-2643)]
MPLTIIVVGAGLAGLSTALALAQNGHRVKIFEQSSFLNEVGAAIHVSPNATRLLRRWRLPLDTLEGVKCTRLRIWNDKEKYLSTPVTTAEIQVKTGNPDDWLLVHRVDLHNILRKAVQNDPATEFLLASKVISVDYEKGSILLADGSRHEADLVIGADGIHLSQHKSDIHTDANAMATLHKLDWLFAIGVIFFCLSIWGIGANDVANSYATSVSSQTLTLIQAGVLATITEFIGAIALGQPVYPVVETVGSWQF